MSDVTLDVLAAVGRMLIWACVFALLLYSPLSTRRNRRKFVRAMSRALWALVKALAWGLWVLLWAPALALLWVIRRFDEIEDRRRDWQLDHARQCRQLARYYRHRDEAGDLASAVQLDWLARMFDDDAADADADADEVDVAWRDSPPEVADWMDPPALPAKTPPYRSRRLVVGWDVPPPTKEEDH